MVIKTTNNNQTTMMNNHPSPLSSTWSDGRRQRRCRSQPAILVGLIIYLILLPSSLTGADAAASVQSYRYRRQATPTTSSSTALAQTSSSSAMVKLANLILPTIRAILHAPMRLFQELLAEIRLFLGTHNFSEMLDTTFLRQMVQRLPERAGAYWMSFVELESECIQRTLCDLADFTTHHVPHWVKQILLIYFTTFNQNVYFEAINNGLIAHNCQAKFSQCDPNSFLSRLSNNVSESIHTTVKPIQKAFNELVNVTVSTFDSISMPTEPTPIAKPLNAVVDENDQEFELNERSGLVRTNQTTDNIVPTLNEIPMVPERPPAAGWMPAMTSHQSQPPMVFQQPPPMMIHHSHGGGQPIHQPQPMPHQ